jgi:YfiH family protein
MDSFSHSWMQPDWPAHPRVRAVMTDRSGGISSAPWDSMNLGDHVGDHLPNVHVNRQRLQDAIGVRPVFLKQVHGVDAMVLDASSRDGVLADACLTTGTDAACTIMVADCLPVLMCDASGRWVAAAHAGWRGLAGVNGVGVLESLLTTLGLSRTARQDVLVWLGPCIGPLAFEVGSEVMAAFCVDDSHSANFFTPAGHGKWRADLPGLARWRLRRMGLERVYGNDSTPDWCTFSQNSRFFSHRRDGRVLGQSGRMAACIWLVD